MMNIFPILCHLSALVGVVVPFGNILGPLIVWLWKKADPRVQENGRASINFQLSATLYLVIYSALFMAFLYWIGHNPSAQKAELLRLPFILVIPMTLLVISQFGLTLYGAYQASQGVVFRYPLTIRFLKAPAH